jgi:copper resistance protein D
MDGVSAVAEAYLDPHFVLLLTRWIHFGAVFILFGSALFWLYAPEDFPRARNTTVAMLRVTALMAVMSGVGGLWAMLADMAGGFGAVFERETLSLFFLETQFGPIAAVRLLLFAAVCVSAFGQARNRGWMTTLAALGGLLLVDQAWLGHAAEGGASFRGAAMIVAYCLHTLAGAAWVGGLPPLLFALHEAGDEVGAATAQRAFAVLARFSNMAIVAVVLIVATGLANTAFHVTSIEALFRSEYGAVLAIKGALVVAMLALAWYNRFIGMSALRAAAEEGVRIASARLRLSVAVELGLGIAVIGAAAWLGMTPPPR